MSTSENVERERAELLELARDRRRQAAHFEANAMPDLVASQLAIAEDLEHAAGILEAELFANGGGRGGGQVG